MRNIRASHYILALWAFCWVVMDSPLLAAKKTTKKAVFTGEQLTLEKIMNEVLTASKSVNEKGAKGKSARQTLEKAVDWTGVAQICLGGPSEWKKQSPKNRNRFSSLLKDIVSLTAYSRMGSFWDDTTYTIDKIEVNKNSGVVTTNFTADDEDYVLAYYFQKAGSRWRIVDLSFDEDKYSDNIREQIRAFLKEKSFSVLLQKLEKRKADLKAGNKEKNA